MILPLLISLSFSMIKVVIIDTDFNPSNKDIPMCVEGVVEFDKVKTGASKHGAKIAQKILDISGKNTHCQIHITFSPNDIESYLSALEYTLKIDNIDILNMSISSKPYSIFELTRIKHNTKIIKKEKEILEKLLQKNVSINVSAGNDGVLVTKNFCNVFPACISPKLNVIGYKFKDKISNYGDFVDSWEDGYKVTSKEGSMTGSSISTAIYTGKNVLKLYKERNGRN